MADSTGRDGEAQREAWVREVQRELGVDETTAVRSVKAALHALARLLPWDARAVVEKYVPESLGRMLEGEKTAHDVQDLLDACAREGR